MVNECKVVVREINKVVFPDASLLREAPVVVLDSAECPGISIRDAWKRRYFTRYKSPTGHFGWDVNEKKGWAFRFSRFDQWHGGFSGNPLSHMGKHAPLLLLPPDRLPPQIEEYLLAVNPRHAEPRPPFMHGFLVDVRPGLSCRIQYRLDGLLETVAESI